MHNIISGNVTPEEVKEHEEKWGKFNDCPPNFEEITAEEFAQSGFFTWCKEKIEFRQINPAKIPQDKIKSPITSYISITLFFMNDPHWHYAMSGDYWEKKVRYFRFSECIHDYSEKGVGRCLHQYTCSKCGKQYTVDSSD